MDGSEAPAGFRQPLRDPKFFQIRRRRQRNAVGVQPLHPSAGAVAGHVAGRLQHVSEDVNGRWPALREPAEEVLSLLEDARIDMQARGCRSRKTVSFAALHTHFSRAAEANRGAGRAADNGNSGRQGPQSHGGAVLRKNRLSAPLPPRCGAHFHGRGPVSFCRAGAGRASGRILAGRGRAGIAVRPHFQELAWPCRFISSLQSECC